MYICMAPGRNSPKSALCSFYIANTSAAGEQLPKTLGRNSQESACYVIVCRK